MGPFLLCTVTIHTQYSLGRREGEREREREKIREKRVESGKYDKDSLYQLSMKCVCRVAG